MKALAALLLAAALAACAPTAEAPTPTPTPPPVDDAQACAAQGGTIQPVCRRQVPACVIAYKDAGKACRDDADCQGRCLYEGDPPADREAAVTGQCQANSNPCGCFAEVEAGRYTRGVCVD
ncbi:hypothetical protein [Phenylobacterium sp.]|uniref:hypothetical protein n=1 Tax=Phenylobacterium sp. TaxID=1871053 RepID=UPI0035B317E7